VHLPKRPIAALPYDTWRFETGKMNIGLQCTAIFLSYITFIPILM